MQWPVFFNKNYRILPHWALVFTIFFAYLQKNTYFCLHNQNHPQQ